MAPQLSPVIGNAILQTKCWNTRRYVLDMRVAPEQRDAIVELVQRVAPGAVASERGGHHVSFSLPPQSLDIPTLFEQVRAWAQTIVHLLVRQARDHHQWIARPTSYLRLASFHSVRVRGPSRPPGITPSTEASILTAQVEAQRRALGIEEYSLSQTTLEQVFVNLAQREAAAADQS